MRSATDDAHDGEPEALRGDCGAGDGRPADASRSQGGSSVGIGTLNAAGGGAARCTGSGAISLKAAALGTATGELGGAKPGGGVLGIALDGGLIVTPSSSCATSNATLSNPLSDGATDGEAAADEGALRAEDSL